MVKLGGTLLRLSNELIVSRLEGEMDISPDGSIRGEHGCIMEGFFSEDSSLVPMLAWDETMDKVESSEGYESPSLRLFCRGAV
mmetsp:Transcript_11440/g.18633  ORF Transcript_11440/g.18633 Transcript_11440/m.18633 type:complete len:83 (+) Transcript_11440:176-424(+)